MKPNIDKISRAIGSTTRLQIIGLLDKHELSVGEIAEDLKISQSATSQHLAKLRDADLVVSRKEGQLVYYNLANNGVADFAAQLVNEIGQQL